MIKNNRNNEQIYGRNDMIMLDPNNKIYGSLGLADKYVMKTEEGTRLILSNPKLGSFSDVLTEFNIYGMSSQNKTTGKNLLKYPYIMADEMSQGIIFTDNKNGSISVSGTATGAAYYNFYQNIDGKRLTLASGTYKLVVKGRNKCNVVVSNDVSTAVNVGTFTITDGHNEIYCYISVQEGVTVDETIYPMIQLASITDESYEPYTGGKPSPSPEYPQEIKSVGENGSIEVNVRGKNLTDIYGYSAVGIENLEDKRVLSNEFGTTLNTTEKADKLIVNQEILDGANLGSYKSGYFVIGINQKFEAEKNYIITFKINVLRNPLSASTVEVSFNGISFSHGNIIGNKVIAKASYTEYRKRQYVEIRNNGMSLEVSDFMITEEDENAIYEPYYEPQTIFINTSIGVPAIPVASGGNITIGGQQYIADYVDVERGKLYKKVKRINVKDVEDINVAYGSHSNGNGYLSLNVGNVNEDISPISNQYRGSKWTNESGYVYIPKSGFVVIVDDRFIDRQTAIKLVQDTYVFYALASQTEINLAPEVIEQYKKLSVKAQTTIIENNYNTWMKATYKSTESV